MSEFFIICRLFSLPVSVGMAYPCFHYLVHNLVKYVMAFFAPIRETSKFLKKVVLKGEGSNGHDREKSVYSLYPKR